jgi:8-amino-7-oxononanoate synthase
MSMSEDHSAAAHDELRRIADAGLLRRLRTLDSPQGDRVEIGGRSLVNFSSNDYLGLANSEALKVAMIEGVQRFGAGAGASRLVCGNLSPHQELEEALAQFKSTEAALAFSSGYATALGVIPALCGKDDVIILDKLSHASLIDAAKLSGATLRIFPHNHVERLEHLLETVRARHSANARVLVVTESIFSMDGDAAPLAAIVALTEKHGALLLVDEAHAVGVLGPQGRGLIAALGLEKRVPLQMGTLSKALGTSGGYVAASRAMVDLLINKARSLIYSTAPPPALAFAAAASLRLVQSDDGDQRRDRLQKNIRQVQAALGSTAAERSETDSRRLPEGRARRRESIPTVQSSSEFSAILPLIIGDESAAMQAAEALQREGHLIPAIRYPTVARGTARLRLTLSALHELAQIEGLVACLQRIMTELLPAAPPALQIGADQPLTARERGIEAQ